MFIIKKLQNKDIDRKHWDVFIDKSPQRNIYAQSWYLDIAARNWKAYFVYQNNQLVAVLPFTEGKKIVIPYIIQPILCQQLGLFTDQNTSNTPEIISAIISTWKNQQWLVNYNFNIANFKELEDPKIPFALIHRLTHHLELNLSYNEIYNNYSTNHKRNLKKAIKAELNVSESTDIDSIIDLFRKNKRLELKNVKDYHFQEIKNLFRTALEQQSAKLLIATNNNGNILSGCLYLYYKNTVIYLFGGSSDEGKQLGASVMIHDTFIRQHANTAYVLDFEGSNIPSLARFYRGFGASEKWYPQYNINRIGFLMKLYKYVRSR